MYKACCMLPILIQAIPKKITLACLMQAMSRRERRSIQNRQCSAAKQLYWHFRGPHPSLHMGCGAVRHVCLAQLRAG